MLYIFSIYTKTIAVSIPNIAPNKTSFGVCPINSFSLFCSICFRNNFINRLLVNSKYYEGYRMLAVDGSDLCIPHNPKEQKIILLLPRIQKDTIFFT